MSVRVWVAVAAVCGLASGGWAQGPGGKQCGPGGGGSMRGGGGPATMRGGGGQGVLRASPTEFQLQQAQLQQAQLQQLQSQMLALQLADASASGRANFARIQAAKRERARLKAEQKAELKGDPDAVDK